MTTIKSILILSFVFKATQLTIFDRNEKIFNGFEAPRGFYPFVVAIFANNTDSWEHVSGGAVIEHEWILTAVHCLRTRPLKQCTANEFLVVAGTHRIKPNFDLTQQSRSVIAYFYPDPDREFHHQSGYLEDDIALLQHKRGK
ncbi:unnamed protein product, partial [Mesorhabditis belari]|uniref:Peptidase S1 domain-containing protein n=1 Tax=Mesorhabditis belari TaxID=2138241 RepID=A0AAF3FKB1_9BILA